MQLFRSIAFLQIFPHNVSAAVGVVHFFLKALLSFMGFFFKKFDSLCITAYHFHKSIEVFFLLSVVQLISAVSQITVRFHILSLFIHVSQKKKFKITNFLFHSTMENIHFLSLMCSKICISSSWFPNGYLDEVVFFNTI